MKYLKENVIFKYGNEPVYIFCADYFFGFKRAYWLLVFENV